MQNMDPPRSILARFLFHLGEQAGTRGCCRGRVLFCSLPRVISARTQTTSRSRLGTSQNPEERGNVQQKKRTKQKPSRKSFYNLQLCRDKSYPRWYRVHSGTGLYIISSSLFCCNHVARQGRWLR